MGSQPLTDAYSTTDEFADNNAIIAALEKLKASKS
jgi:hypothetical protein